MSKALVLEDAPGLQRVIFNKLTQQGYEVSGTDNVNDALQLLSNNDSFDFFWIEHDLVGELSGLDFLSAVRQDARYSHHKDTPVLLVSNLDQETLNLYELAAISKYYDKTTITVNDVVNDLSNILA